MLSENPKKPWERVKRALSHHCSKVYQYGTFSGGGRRGGCLFNRY